MADINGGATIDIESLEIGKFKRKAINFKNFY
jgi:hypothetical protein